MVFMISVALSLPRAKNGINKELMADERDEIWEISGILQITRTAKIKHLQSIETTAIR